MANLVITNACNLRCAFCFASEYRSADGAAHMSVAELRAHLDFLDVDTVRFCGGEPTLHPDFCEMLDVALEPAQRRVSLMTNGLWPAVVRRHVAALSRRRTRRISYLINVLEPVSYAPGQGAGLRATLDELPPGNVTLGVTLYRTPFDPAHLFALAEAFGIARIRYSVAAPNITDPLSWNVDPPRDFRSLANDVHALVVAARRRGLAVQSDCGYIPPCMFTPAQLVELQRDSGEGAAVRFSCDGPIDIGPGGVAWRCYGLYSTIRGRTGDFPHPSALEAHFAERTALLSERFLFDECATCDLRSRGECGGGCYAFRSVRALRARARDCRVGIETSEDLLTAIPGIDGDNLHVMGPRVMLREPDGTWAPLAVTDAEAALLAACDGTRTVAMLIAELERMGEGPDPQTTVTRFVRRLFDQGGIGLHPSG